MNLYRTLTEMPWKGHRDEASALAAHPGGTLASAPQRTALWFFLGIVAVLFGLFITAYFVRMELADWRPMPESPLLWFNTFVLFLSSMALQWTRSVAKRYQPGKVEKPHQTGRVAKQHQAGRVKVGLLLGGVLTLGFVAGQFAVWRNMSASGYLIYNNPANSFFYVLTGLHALHILGGLWVWMRAAFRVFSGAAVETIRLSVELCAVYWHFLLLVWLVLFGLLSYT